MTAAAGDDQPKRRLSVKQRLISDEFVNEYGIAPESISFEGESEEPIFHFDALMQLALTMASFKEISVTPGTNMFPNVVSAEGVIRLEDDRVVRMFGSCVLGETLYEGNAVADLPSAFDVARTRALRTTLRAVGFDPLRAHRARKGGAAAEERSALDPRTRDLRQIHLLADDLGWITGADDAEYRRQIGVYFPGHTSSGDLSDAQRSQLIAIMRGLLQARRAAR